MLNRRRWFAAVASLASWMTYFPRRAAAGLLNRKRSRRLRGAAAPGNAAVLERR
jgi:hypothetical protein